MYVCMWGSKRVDRCGKIIEDLILKQNISILNDGSNTYLHPGTGSLSTIDHSVCDPSLYTDFTSSVSDGLCGSDHFSVFLSTVLTLNLLLLFYLEITQSRSD